MKNDNVVSQRNHLEHYICMQRMSIHSTFYQIDYCNANEIMKKLKKNLQYCSSSHANACLRKCVCV